MRFYGGKNFLFERIVDVNEENALVDEKQKVGQFSAF